ncbi:NXPE family member 3-like [Cyprinodon tularosa]|uniref:NXPE family member 3-like n=1 Tax=Cyprinodon tularosa TaxID=77115 RepID=UPI0018E280FC|nr:NXPE family member 3-like [Cyprinodon tularosa]
MLLNKNIYFFELICYVFSSQKSCVLTELKKKLSDIMAPKPASVTSMTTALPSNMTSIHPSEPPSACSFHAVSPEDAQELAMIMESIAWPETPPLLSNLSLENTSDPAHSTFTILPRNGGGSWQIGDQLEVLIKMFDFNGRPKRSGGDVLYARLANRALYAGVAGKVFDHRNGSYTAVFSLLWEGTAQVEVTLVHPSEAVTLLEKVTREEPGRAYSLSVFRSGSVTETVRCNVCLEGPKQKLCNYTDLHTGEPWFCYKPKKLNCDMRVTHSKGGFTQIKQPMEDQLLQLGVNMKVSISASGPASIDILPKPKGGANENLKTTPAGYYYQGVWRALDGTTVHQFNNATAISQCLKGKMVHLYGDSTVRQWFEYLIANTPDLQKFDLKSPPRAGPYMALDYKRNILVTYRCHGTPIFFTPMSVSETCYITSELRGVVGSTNTVIIIAVWAHFSTFPVEVYIRRLLNIRRAVELLLSRAPGTLVIIRTGNPKTLKASEARIGSDWYSLQRDKILRAIFKGVKVRLVDAWEMCLAHHLPHSLHPQPPIIKNMIDVVLSHICSPGGDSKPATKKSKEKN